MVRAQKANRRGDLLRGCVAPKGDLRLEGGMVVFRKTVQHGRIDRARRDAVDANAVRRPLPGEVARHLNDSALGDRINRA